MILLLITTLDFVLFHPHSFSLPAKFHLSMQSSWPFHVITIKKSGYFVKYFYSTLTASGVSSNTLDFYLFLKTTLKKTNWFWGRTHIDCLIYYDFVLFYVEPLGYLMINVKLQCHKEYDNNSFGLKILCSSWIPFVIFLDLKMRLLKDEEGEKHLRRWSGNGGGGSKQI
jgi:hypothetical protein